MRLVIIIFALFILVVVMVNWQVFFVLGIFAALAGLIWYGFKIEGDRIRKEDDAKRALEYAEASRRKREADMQGVQNEWTNLSRATAQQCNFEIQRASDRLQDCVAEMKVHFNSKAAIPFWEAAGQAAAWAKSPNNVLAGCRSAVEAFLKAHNGTSFPSINYAEGINAGVVSGYNSAIRALSAIYADGVANAHFGSTLLKLDSKLGREHELYGIRGEKSMREWFNWLGKRSEIEWYLGRLAELFTKATV